MLLNSVRLLALSATAAFILSAPATAQTMKPEACDSTEASKRAERKIEGWYKDTGRALRANQDVLKILRKIEEEYAKDRYDCSDRNAFYGASLFIGAKSKTPSVKAQALGVIVQSTTYDDGSDKVSNMYSLIHAFQVRRDFSALAALAARELPAAPEGLKTKLAHIHATTLADQGQYDEALNTLLPVLNTAAKRRDRNPFHLAIALAQELGDAEVERMVREKADATFTALRMPAPHPLAGDDLLETLIMRNAGVLHETRPTRHPVPSYPDGPTYGEKEGQCNVFMDVDSEGRPYNIEAECTDDAFRRASEKAIEDVRFEPLVIDGTAYDQFGIEYPIEYRVE